MSGFTVFIVGIVICIVLFVALVAAGSAKSSGIKNKLEQLKFISYETFVSEWDRSFVALNFETKKIALGRDEALTICDFRKIIKVDLQRNNATVTTTDRGSLVARAIVGGVLLGGVGAIAGAVTAKTQSTQGLKRIDLRVITEDGTFTIVFLKLGDVAQNHGLDQLIETQLNAAERFYGLILRAMREAAQTSAENRSRNLERQSLTAAVVESRGDVGLPAELEKLWKLKEQGAISLDEFERTKRAMIPRE